MYSKVPILAAETKEHRLLKKVFVTRDSNTEVLKPASPPMRPERLCVLAQRIAAGTTDFFNTKGPGKGDHATAEFVRSLGEAARGMFGSDYSEKSACAWAGFRFDFFFPEEAVAVEFAFGLHNPNSEFERDIFKCLLAIDDGCFVKRLMLVGKPGAITRLTTPAPKAIISFVKKRFDLTVEVFELQRKQGGGQTPRSGTVNRRRWTA
jgi:hypothetical protein